MPDLASSLTHSPDRRSNQASATNIRGTVTRNRRCVAESRNERQRLSRRRARAEVR